jgi:hypothetical protein
MYTGENQTMRAKECRNRNFDATEQSLELVFSKEQAETLYLFFSGTKAVKKYIKNILA